jgi:hypothetical protein
VAQTKHRDDQLFVAPVEFADEIVPGAANSGAAPAPAAGVSTLFDRARFVRHTRLTIEGATLSIAAADDFGSLLLATLPDSNLMLLAVELDLELVKGEEVGGLVAATDVGVAVGTAAASNATLSGAMIDVLDQVDLTASDASPALQVHSQADATLTYPIQIADGASSELYLNAAASITADDALTVTGTVDLYWVDLGNVTS